MVAVTKHSTRHWWRCGKSGIFEDCGWDVTEEKKEREVWQFLKTHTWKHNVTQLLYSQVQTQETEKTLIYTKTLCK